MRALLRRAAIVRPACGPKRRSSASSCDRGEVRVRASNVCGRAKQDGRREQAHARAESTTQGHVQTCTCVIAGPVTLGYAPDPSACWFASARPPEQQMTRRQQLRWQPSRKVPTPSRWLLPWQHLAVARTGPLAVCRPKPCAARSPCHRGGPNAAHGCCRAGAGAPKPAAVRRACVACVGWVGAHV